MKDMLVLCCQFSSPSILFYHLQFLPGPVGPHMLMSLSKNLPAEAGDMGKILGPGRFCLVREGNGNPLWSFCFENPMERGTWQATV